MPRKRLDPNTVATRVQLVAPASLLVAIDAWRVSEMPLSNRSEAIRLLVERGLKARRRKKPVK